MGLRLRRRNKYKQHTPIDYVLVDKYHPYVSDPGDSENPWSLSDRTMVMHPVFVTAKNLSGKNTNPFNLSDEDFVRGSESQTVQNLHSRRWAEDNPEEYERQRLSNIQQNEGLQIVSPEFDLLTLGMAGRDLWKAYNTYKALGNVPLSYTGVPREKAPFFRRFKGKIYTTDDIKLAEQYATGDFGRANNPGGRVFKIYDMENGKDIVKIPEPEINPQTPNEKYAYHWFRIPYEIDENGIVKKIATGSGNVDQWIPNKDLNQPLSFTTPVSNKAGIYRTSYGVRSTDDLAVLSDYAGKRGVEVPSVVDGAYAVEDEFGNVIMEHPAFTERVYLGNKPGLIRAPIDEPEWLTIWRNTRNMGSSLTNPGINMVFSNNGQ